MKRFYFLLISFLTLSFIVIAQVKMFVHQSNGNIVEILASRVDSISLLFPSKEEPDDPDVPVEPVFYTISFDANGGIGALSPEYLEDNESLIIPSNVFSRDGYTFICWNTKADGTGTIYTPGQSLAPTENITLYAQWEEKNVGETIVLRAEQIENTGKVKITAEYSITPTNIVWLYKTEGGEYTEIEGENTNVLIFETESSKYTYVKAYILNEYGEKIESEPIIINTSCLSVVFTDDFGTFTNETDRAQTPYIGHEYTYVPGCEPLREEGTYAVMVNPKFAGDDLGYGCHVTSESELWYRDIYDHTQGGLIDNKWGGLLMVNADAELVYSREVVVPANTFMTYSAWAAYASDYDGTNSDAYFESAITFVVRGGHGGNLVEMQFNLEDGNDGWQKGEVAFNTEENTRVTIELYNYNKGGIGNDFVIDDISFSICDEANVGIVAPVSISFNANGGLGNMNTEQINPLVCYTLPSNKFIKENYFFTGWNTKADGTGETLVVGQSMFIKEDLTLYAQWVKGVTVSFNANGGNGAMNSMIINPTKSFEIPTNTFTNEDNFCKGWNTKADGTGIAYAGAQTISITESVTLYAQWEKLITTGIENGHGYVDLGLPSGLKWATMNVGAESPEDYGDYFAWGETESKSIYNWESYKWCDGSSDTMTKYCTDSYYGTLDNKTVLDLADDAANTNWHSDWRMPTNAEQDELRTECTWAWGTLNGVKGCKVTSKTNGNSIFLPATGYRYYNYLYHEEVYGHYWSNTLYTRPNYAYNLCFHSGSNMSYSEGSRNYGHSIRPVIRVKETYTLTFNANNGEGIMSVIKAKEDEQISIPSNTFTRPAHKFIGWNTKADGTGVSYSADQTITLTENLTLYAQWKAFEMSGIENGYGYVDLGLPSGTKWAIMNIGAESPEEYGDYFAWGEIQPKSSYTWSSYKHMTAGKSSWEYVNKYTYADAQTSGVWYSGSTFIGDNKKTLDSIDDVAQVSWGGNWRMPTKSGIDELRSNCTWTWTTQDGVSGYKVVSKTNGKSIFLPAAGYNEGSTVSSATTAGNYWSNTVGSSYSDYAYFLTFNSSSVTGSDKSRNRGNTVRAVIPALLNITLVANGGEGTMPNVKSEYGATVALPENTFTRTGYTFTGWNTKADGTGTAYRAGQTISLTENLTLYAQWGEPLYLYFVNTYAWTDINVYIWTGTSNDYISWPGEDAKKENFTINGYDVYSYDMSDKQLYDMIIFNGYDSSFREKTEDLYVNYSTPYYYAGKWYSSIDEINKMTVTFEANGGEGTMSPIYAEYGSFINLSDYSFTRPGYKLVGWNTSAYGTGIVYTLDQSITVNGNITLYAQWQKVFIVSFNANDGSGIISSVELEGNESFNIPSNVFTNSMNEFLGWNAKADGTGDVYTVGQSITLTEDLTLYAQWKLIVGIENGYQWVDLGLTSKTKWATMNVGATSEEGSGKYFAYGETQSKASYSSSNYTYSISSDVLPLFNDAAHVNWGGSWVIPTKEQQDELRAECIWTWTSRNGVDGYQVTSKVNGSSIFMPAVGYRRYSYSDSDGWMGYYWSSTATSSYGAYYMEFNNSGIGWNYDEEEYYGMSVRPVVPSIRIKFDANGGEGIMPYNYLETAGSYTIPNNSFIREYYLFVGWNTEADGTGIAYKEGEITTISSDVTLYAQWEKNRKLYFVNTIGWSSVGVYIWIDGTTTSYLEWPGESATKESITVNGYSIYSYNMVGKDQYDMIIFNNGTSQTSDLRIDYTKPYYYNGEWYSSLEDIVDKSEQYGYHSGYEWVDLGLTSGTLWARMNVGADSPEDYGDYFAWGEIETKEEYNWSTYKWCEGSYDTQNKYCTSSSYGTIDNKTTLDLADDAANANWDGNWRMPTKAEQDELRNECTWTWARNNGVKGYFVTGPNGNSIFLPAAGCREDSDLDNVGSYCSYWGSSLDSGSSSAAYYLYFYSDSIYCSSRYRSRGQSVRPVLSK